MAENRLEKMLKKMDDDAPLFMRFHKLVSKETEKSFLIFEGHDDPAFYSVAFSRCGRSIKYLPFVAGGKDKVLSLREIISNHSEKNFGKGVLFFIDHDFDGYKGYSMHPSTYCTPTYSIENIAVSKKSLLELLINEFKLSTSEGIEDIKNIIEKFEQSCQQFISATELLNKAIYFGRLHCTDGSSPKIRSITDDEKKIFHIDNITLEVQPQYSNEHVFNLVNFSPVAPPLDEIISKIDVEFSKICPFQHWRGKFWLQFFKKFVSILVEDINSKIPNHFSSGNAKVKMSLSSDSIFRILASACDIPPCLNLFIANCESNMLKAG